MAAARLIVIAGAGIGGLTAALALAAQGFRVVVLEKAERLDEIGAGLQLSPNAARVLIALGLSDAIAARAIAPDAVRLMSARAGGDVARLPLGEAAASGDGSPYWVIHRADLQAILLAAIRRTPAIEVWLGHAFKRITRTSNGVTVDASNAKRIDALALIGADGVWSAVRQQLFPKVQPEFSGLIAWRGTIATDADQTAMTDVQVWMGPNAHIVVYPIAGGRQFNVVVITRGDATATGDVADIRSLLATGWPQQAQSMLNAVDRFTRYPLFTMPDGGVWNDGPMTLLGDAAHAMLPFAAQGAGMAIEDAAVLAACIGRSDAATPPSIAVALATYAGQRRQRILRVQRTARQSGTIYHLRGPMALARDLAIRALGGKRLLARQNWIYDWTL